MEEQVGVVVREVVELKKFDGDPPAAGEHKEPVEVRELVYENGELVSDRVTKKE